MFVTRATRSTSSAGIVRINDYQLHTDQGGFVLHKVSQLAKRPTAVAAALPMPNRSSLSDMSQILQSECLACFRRLAHQAFADNVVCILLKTAFFTAISFQSPSGAFRANGLQAIATALIAFSYSIDLLAAERFTVVSGSKVYNAKVNAKHTQRFFEIRKSLGLRDAKIPDAVLVDHFRATDFPSLPPVVGSRRVDSL